VRREEEQNMKQEIFSGVFLMISEKKEDVIFRRKMATV
jgi:hypothetical protein